MKKSIIFLLLIFVFLAGCTQTSGGGSGPGVVIKSSAVIPTGDVEPGSPLTLDAIIQNDGVATARNVRVDIVGLTDEWGISPGRSQVIGDLFSSDPSRGVAGSEIPLDWSLTPPGKANDMTYNGYIRVTYSYDTTLDAQIQIVTLQEYKQNGVQGGIIEQSATAGPVSLSAVTQNAIISGGVGRVPVTISIQNNGPGKIMGDRLIFTVSGINCLRNDITLIEGTSGTLSCSIDTSGVANLKDIPITVRTSYDYWVESPFSITVLKNPPI